MSAAWRRPVGCQQVDARLRFPKGPLLSLRSPGLPAESQGRPAGRAALPVALQGSTRTAGVSWGACLLEASGVAPLLPAKERRCVRTSHLMLTPRLKGIPFLFRMDKPAKLCAFLIKPKTPGPGAALRVTGHSYKKNHALNKECVSFLHLMFPSRTKQRRLRHLPSQLVLVKHRIYPASRAAVLARKRP